MKILHTVEFYHPSVGGMQESVKQISEGLAQKGHEVVVATSKLANREGLSSNGVQIVEFQISGNAVRGMTGEVEKYRQFLLHNKFDMIVNFAAQQWATDLMLPLLNNIKAKKVFVPVGFSGLCWPEYQEYYTEMKTWFHQYDSNIFLSDTYQDINFARNCGVKNLVLIPNGAAASEFLPETKINIKGRLGIPDDHDLIVHVGSHTGVKGHAEAIKIFELAGIKKTTLLIIGNNVGGGCYGRCKIAAVAFRTSPLRKIDNKQLKIISLSREETVAAYKAADLFLFPSNIECSPLVLFECLASQTPFLATDAGNVAEIIEWSDGGRLLPTCKDRRGFSRVDIIKAVPMLEEVIENHAQREVMRAAGYKAWLERFTWEKIVEQYEQVYSRLIIH